MLFVLYHDFISRDIGIGVITAGNDGREIILLDNIVQFLDRYGIQYRVVENILVKALPVAGIRKQTSAPQIAVSFLRIQN